MIKRFIGIFCALVLLCATSVALADDAGVLSEGELNAWLTQTLRASAEREPLNAPVGEESLTEDGYAFLYDFATLYYDKPVLDESSVLNAVVLTDESFAAPRGIRIGNNSDTLLDTYGWQNPYLLGDGSFASFYRLDELPRAAYWSWAQHEGDTLFSVQCALHVQVSEDRYTDAGVVYTLENNVVTAIRVYGLNRFISEADVRSNLRAVMSVEAAGSGDEMEYEAPQATPYTTVNDQPVFASDDLAFGGVDYRTMTETEATQAFGAVVSQEEVADDTGDTLITTTREGIIISYTVGESGSKAESLDVSVESIAGPRGISVGMPLAEVLALFPSDGEGRVNGSEAILYGDVFSNTCGTMELFGEDATLRFVAEVDGEAVTLIVSFTQDVLTDWMLYSW